MDAYWKRTAWWYGGVGLLAASAARNVSLPPRYLTLVVHEIETMGVRSLGVALTAAVFTGMVFSLQSAVNMARFGAEAYVGPLVALAIFRELGPVLTAILVGGKVASGITAELGSMKVTEQVDAIRAMGADPIQKLVLPRVVAAVVMLPLLTVLADALGVLGGLVIADLQYGISPHFFVQTVTTTVTLDDFLSGVAKTPCFGAIIAFVGCFLGLRTTGGTVGVGSATRRAVVTASIAVLIADFFLTKALLAL
jgi:phospholipid/cholesterol/gamma-HCH transport system permease protein